MSKAEESQTGGKAMGRPPADEPDVYVYVPSVKVGELCVDVERLDAHLALRTQVANLVNLVAGVHLGVDKVKIDLKDVEAECELKVRLENTYNILDRTLTTLDENPQVSSSCCRRPVTPSSRPARSDRRQPSLVAPSASSRAVSATPSRAWPARPTPSSS
ncbi:MAG TPA: hypothetical protein VHJ37_06070 [Thermoleophilaceae bacterium]|nr:hypothetical protein [Thermoleophilaceae bacterium]